MGNHKQCAGKTVASINTRCRQVLDTVKAAIALVKEYGGILIVAGDFLDVVRPEAPVLAEVQKLLSEVDCFLLKGNHESVSAQKGDHSLAPLAPVCTIVEEPTIEIMAYKHDQKCAVFFVPFRPEAGVVYIERDVKALTEQWNTMCSEEGIKTHLPKVLVIHAGISDASTNSIMSGTREQIGVRDLARICSENDILNVFAGNWHDRKTIVDSTTGVVVHQIGALCPTGWNNPGLDLYGTVSRYTAPGHKPEDTIIPGPRFIQAASMEEALSLSSTYERPDLVYVKIVTDIENYGKESAQLNACIESGTICGGSCLLDKKDMDTKAIQAADNAREALTTENALAEYVEEMPLKELPDGLNTEKYDEEFLREEIFHLCSNFMKG